MTKSFMRKGLFSSKKMSAYMEQCMKKSMSKTNQEKLDSILETAAQIEIFSTPSLSYDVDAHFNKIVDGKIPRKKIKRSEYYLVSLAGRSFFSKNLFMIYYMNLEQQ